MNQEQAVIKTGTTEIPVVALDEPLLWCVALGGFLLGLVWIFRTGRGV